MRQLAEEFRHEDGRRTLIQLFTADVKQVNIYLAKKGSILGEHYHKETDEFFYIVHGSILYNDQKILETGDAFVVYPQEAHRIECLTDTKLMTFLTKPFDQEKPDLWKN